MFYEHHEKSLCIECVLVNSMNLQPQATELCINSVISLESPPSQVLKHNLYELRSQYPVFDCVGFLQDKQKNDWLVFIQVSLQAYKKCVTCFTSPHLNIVHQKN